MGRSVSVHIHHTLAGTISRDNIAEILSDAGQILTAATHLERTGCCVRFGLAQFSVGIQPPEPALITQAVSARISDSQSNAYRTAVAAAVSATNTGRYSTDAIRAVFLRPSEFPQNEIRNVPVHVYVVNRIDGECPGSRIKSAINPTLGCAAFDKHAIFIAAGPEHTPGANGSRRWPVVARILWAHELGHLLSLHDHPLNFVSPYLMAGPMGSVRKLALRPLEAQMVCEYAQPGLNTMSDYLAEIGAMWGAAELGVTSIQ